MSLEAFIINGSPYAWRVLLTLELKGIAYTPRALKASEGEHEKPEFLALNPRGKVPVIRDDGYVLSESLAIMAYLERKVPEPPLFGGSAEETGRIWQAIEDADSYLLAPAAKGIVMPILFGQVPEDVDAVPTAVALVHEELARLEAGLADGGWMAGASVTAVTAADVALYPFIEIMLRAAGKDEAKEFDLGLLPFGDFYPGLEAWRVRMTELPGYGRTYPPHWRSAA